MASLGNTAKKQSDINASPNLRPDTHGASKQNAASSPTASSTSSTIKTKSTIDLLHAIRQAGSQTSLSSQSSINNSTSNLLASLRSASQIDLTNTAGVNIPPCANKTFGGTKYGLFVDILTIDIVHRDGETFHGNLKKEFILNNVLPTIGIQPNQVHMIKQGYGKRLFFTVKLYNMTDTRKLPKEWFETKIPLPQSDGTIRESTLTCFLRDLETRSQRDHRRGGGKDGDDDSYVRWITIDGNFTIMDNEDLLRDWLVHFGKIISEFESETEKIGDHTIATGRIKVKMVLTDHIPQLVPIHGQKVKFYYRDIKKLCTNCFEIGHYRANCNKERRQWLTFVAQFMERFPEIEKQMYGRWATLLEDELRRVRQGMTSQVVCELTEMDAEPEPEKITETDTENEPETEPENEPQNAESGNEYVEQNTRSTRSTKNQLSNVADAVKKFDKKADSKKAPTSLKGRGKSK